MCSEAPKPRPEGLRLVSTLEETARASESACEHEGGGAWEAAALGRMLDAPRTASPATLCTHALCQYLHNVYILCLWCMLDEKRKSTRR